MKRLLYIVFALLIMIGGANAAEFINGEEQAAAGNTSTHTGAVNPDANYDINDGVSVGDSYVNTTSDAVFVCTDNTATAANWVETSASAAGATTEEIQDGAWGSIGTETLITVTYQDDTNDVDFVVDADLHNYTWTNVVDADIPDAITVGATGSVNAAALPLINEDIGALTDPGADRLGFWDDSAGAFVWLTPGTGLTITDTTITAGVPDENTIEGYIFDADAETITADWDNTANPWAVNEGGTGAATLTDGGILLGSGTGAITALGVATNGQIPIGDGTTDPVLATITGTANEITVTNGAGSITLSLPASIARAESELIDLSAITMSAGVDEGIALPAYADVAPSTEKNYMAYDAANNRIMVRESGGWIDTSAAAGASAAANYITTAAVGGLTDESVFTAGYAIDATDAGGDGGAFTVAFDPTEVSADGSDTWSDGSQAAIVWTFDVSGTDHTMTAGDGLVTFGDAVTVTDTLTANGNITDGTATWNSSTQALSGFASVTATTLTDGTLSINSGSITGLVEGGLPDSTVVTADIKDGEVGTDDLAASLDLSGKTVTFGLESGDIPDLSATYEAVDAEILRADTADNISADMEFQDGIPVSFGNDNDFELSYDTDLADDDAGDNDFEAGTFTTAGLKLNTSSASDIPILFNNSGTGNATLYVKSIVTDSITSSTSSGSSYLGLVNNSGGLAPSGYRLYFETDSVDVLSYSLDGSEKRVMNLEDGQTVSGAKTFTYDIRMSEVADHQSTPGAGYGYLWVKSDTPSSLIFTDDAGTDYDLTAAAGGDIESVGDAASGAALDGSSDGGSYIRLYDGDSNYGEFQVPDISGNVTYTFPSSTSTIATLAGSATQVIFNSGGTTYAGDAGFVFATATDALTLGEDGQDGSLILYNESGGTDYNLTIQPGTQTAAAVITMPGATGTLATLGNAETFSGIKTFSATPVFSAGVDVTGAAGITLQNDETIVNSTDTQILFAANGGENLALDLDTATDNEIAFSSPGGATDLNFGTLNMATTGIIEGAIGQNSDSDGMTQANMTAAGMYGQMYWAGGAGTWALPAVAAGMNICVYSTTAAAVVINPDDADRIILDGTALSDGDSITSASAAGDFICLIGDSADGWTTLGRSGTWTDTD